MSFRISLPRRTTLAGMIISLGFILWQTSYSDVQAQAPQPIAQGKPYVVEYYYKAKWGYAGEFISLFKKNHYPFLKKQMELGNILQVTAESPVYHATEAERWDYRVRIVWKNVQVENDDSDDDRILKQLFPDQDTFKREEQRRFEILLAHWDVPIKTVNLQEK